MSNSAGRANLAAAAADRRKRQREQEANCDLLAAAAAAESNASRAASAPKRQRRRSQRQTVDTGNDHLAAISLATSELGNQFSDLVAQVQRLQSSVDFCVAALTTSSDSAAPVPPPAPPPKETCVVCFESFDRQTSQYSNRDNFDAHAGFRFADRPAECFDFHVVCDVCFPKCLAETNQCPVCRRPLDGFRPVGKQGAGDLRHVPSREDVVEMVNDVFGMVVR